MAAMAGENAVRACAFQADCGGGLLLSPRPLAATLHGLTRRPMAAKRQGKHAERASGAVQVAASSGSGFQPESAMMELMQAVRDGEVSPAEAAKAANTFCSGIGEVSDFAKLDLGRVQRTGFPELVWGPGKTPQQVASIMQELAAHQRSVLATRIEPDVYAAVRKLVPGVKYHGGAKMLSLKVSKELPRKEQPRLPGSVAIVTAGTADLPVAEECRLVAEHIGCYAFKVTDVGVAGLHRVINNLEAIRAASVVIVVAGMDGALPSVVCGLVDSPVIAVPTSIGYGSSMGGIGALLAGLNSCSPGMTVVNIDNGVGAALAAARMLKNADKIIEQRSTQQSKLVADEMKDIEDMLHEQNGSEAGNESASSVVSSKQNRTLSLEPSEDTEYSETKVPADGSRREAALKIGRPLLGLLVFQTGTILPKLAPLGIDASSTLT